jgi:cell division protein FtsZ
MKGVEFIALNTDAQVLAPNKAHKKLRLGENSTRGLGAGGDPSVGEAAAKESEKAILELIENADMVFVTAGMGGGTGTGAAPIVAEIAKTKGILTVGVVSKPFGFEGPKRRKVAEEGALRLAEHVDTLIIVPNDNLSEVVDRR